MTGRGLLWVFTIALAAAPAFARDDAEKLLDQARELARGGSMIEAAEAYAAAFRAAQKQKDIGLQERVGESIQHEVARGALKSSDRRDLHRRVLLALLEDLDGKRNSAFLNPGSVAHSLLFMATRSADMASVELAAAAAKRYAGLPKAGSYARAMGEYGAGLVEVAKGAYGAACPKLQRAFDRCAAEGWATATVHVATELASSYLLAGQAHLTSETLGKTGEVLSASGDTSVAMTWRKLVEGRLADATGEVLAPYRKAMESFNRGSGAGSAGGAGGQGGRGGGRDVSKVGAAWKRLSSRRPFVTVARTADGYAIRQAFDKEFEAVQPFRHGVKHHADGGITLSFWDFGVRLHMVDLTGRRGQPGEASAPAWLVHFHPLARGETWGVDRLGNVTIVGK